MGPISGFLIGVIFTIVFFGLLLLLWGLISVSGQISREEEQRSSDWRRGKE